MGVKEKTTSEPAKEEPKPWEKPGGGVHTGRIAGPELELQPWEKPGGGVYTGRTKFVPPKDHREEGHDTARPVDDPKPKYTCTATVKTPDHLFDKRRRLPNHMMEAESQTSRRQGGNNPPDGGPESAFYEKRERKEDGGFGTERRVSLDDPKSRKEDGGFGTERRVSLDDPKSTYRRRLPGVGDWISKKYDAGKTWVKEKFRTKKDLDEIPAGLSPKEHMAFMKNMCRRDPNRRRVMERLARMTADDSDTV